MKKLLKLALFCLFSLINNAYATGVDGNGWCILASSTNNSTPPSGLQVNVEYGTTGTNCATSEVKYWDWSYTTAPSYTGYNGDYYIQVTSCTSCNKNQYLQTRQSSMPCYGDTSSQYNCGRCLYEYNVCEDCTESCGSGCTTTGWTYTNWSTSGTVRSRTGKKCISGCCVSKTEYSCAPGYYGVADGTNTDCNLCPTNDPGWYTNQQKTTAAVPTSDVGNSGSRGKCYYTSGTYYDEGGKFTVAPLCQRGGHPAVSQPSVLTHSVTRTGSDQGFAVFDWDGTSVTIKFYVACLDADKAHRPTTKPDRNSTSGPYCWCWTNYSEDSYIYVPISGTCSAAGNCYDNCTSAMQGSTTFVTELFR